MKRFQLSPNVCVIPDGESGMAMVYHTLYGNPRIVNRERLQFLELFKQPITVAEVVQQCEGEPEDVVNEFIAIYFLVQPDFDEKEWLREKKAQQLAQVQALQTADRMGLAISD